MHTFPIKITDFFACLFKLGLDSGIRPKKSTRYKEQKRWNKTDIICKWYGCIQNMKWYKDKLLELIDNLARWMDTNKHIKLIALCILLIIN